MCHPSFPKLVSGLLSVSLLLNACARSITGVPITPAGISSTVASPIAVSPPTPIAMPDLFASVNMTYDSARQEIVAFGGYHYPECNECNETWVWNALTWQHILPQAYPPGRNFAGFAYDDATKNSVLFGSPHNPLSNDTWVWDGQNWQEKHPLASPPARWGLPGNILVYDAARQVVVLFGGMVYGDSMNSKNVNDTWLWDGQTWTQVAGVMPPAPELGAGIYMAYDSANQVIVLVDNDTTWIWDGKTWTEQNPSHHPYAVPNGTMGYDEERHETVLVGEEPSSSQSVYPTWVWDGKDWTKIETSTSQIDVNQFGGELHMVYDTRDQKLFLFSLGHGFIAWEWTGDGWQKLYENLSGQAPQK